jgi:hypothetical protein
MDAHVPKPEESLFLGRAVLDYLGGAGNPPVTRELLARLLAGPDAMAGAPKDADALRPHPAFGS